MAKKVIATVEILDEDQAWRALLACYWLDVSTRQILLGHVAAGRNARRALGVLKGERCNGVPHAEALIEEFISIIAECGGTQGRLFVLSQWPQTRHRSEIVQALASSVASAYVALVHSHHGAEFTEDELGQLARCACDPRRTPSSVWNVHAVLEAHAARLSCETRESLIAGVIDCDDVSYLLSYRCIDFLSQEQRKLVVESVAANFEASECLIARCANNTDYSDLTDDELRTVLSIALKSSLSFRYSTIQAILRHDRLMSLVTAGQRAQLNARLEGTTVNA